MVSGAPGAQEVGRRPRVPAREDGNSSDSDSSEPEPSLPVSLLQLQLLQLLQGVIACVLRLQQRTVTQTRMSLLLGWWSIDGKISSSAQLSSVLSLDQCMHSC